MTVEGARRATSHDLGDIARLADCQRAELAEQRGGSIWAARDALPEPADESLRALLSLEGARVAVGTIDGVVVGFGAAVVEELRDATRLGVITALYVEPEARRVGVGEELLALLVSHCDEQGCVGVDAPALPGQREAKNFYEQAGFKARAIVMHRSLR